MQHAIANTLRIINNFAFHRIKKIPKNDERYTLLLSIPIKEYDKRDNVTFVYMRISQKSE